MRRSHSSGISAVTPSACGVAAASIPLKQAPKTWSKRSRWRSSFTSVARLRK